MSDNPGVTPDQMQALLQMASKKLGISPEKFAQTLQQGKISDLAQNLSPEAAAKLDALVGDKAKAQQVVQSAEGQKLLQQLLKNTRQTEKS